MWLGQRLRRSPCFCGLGKRALQAHCSALLLCVCRHSFTEDHYVEFSKHSQDRVIGTKGDIAHVSTSDVAAFELVVPICGVNVRIEILWALRNGSVILFPDGIQKCSKVVLRYMGKRKRTEHELNLAI